MTFGCVQSKPAICEKYHETCGLSSFGMLPANQPGVAVAQRKAETEGKVEFPSETAWGKGVAAASQPGCWKGERGRRASGTLPQTTVFLRVVPLPGASEESPSVDVYKLARDISSALVPLLPHRLPRPNPTLSGYIKGAKAINPVVISKVDFHQPPAKHRGLCLSGMVLRFPVTKNDNTFLVSIQEMHWLGAPQIA